MQGYQIIILMVIAIVLIAVLVAYFYKRQVYNQIDELDHQKKQLFNQAPYDELETVEQLTLAGQSAQSRDQLENQWHILRDKHYPLIENYLFEAEQAADRYRFKESREQQNKAQETIQMVASEIETLREALNHLLESEKENRLRIDKIKDDYRDVRKKLLAHSFSFGSAAKLLEEHLAEMENDFQEFEELTNKGDHEEAQAVIVRLHDHITEMEEQMDMIPDLIHATEHVYREQIEEIKKGYQYLKHQGYLFPEDTILADAETIEKDINRVEDLVTELRLEQAQELASAIEENIEALYSQMEKEIRARKYVYELQNQVKVSIYYLQEEIRKLKIEEDRISQSYILIHDEKEEIIRAEADLKEEQKTYDQLNGQLREDEVPFSQTYDGFDHLFSNLEEINNQLNKIADFLYNYRTEELALKDNMLKMEQELYDMKRRLENQHLPGLPADYLERFFNASDLVEQLSIELARPKLSLVEVRKQDDLCQSNVSQLKQQTSDIIDNAVLAERVAQRLLRYRDQSDGIEETIRHSQKVYNEDYDYERALDIVRAKLENVAPGLYDDIVKQYQQ